MNWLRDHARSIDAMIAGIITAILVELHFAGAPTKPAVMS
jgi:hypothetical protein